MIIQVCIIVLSYPRRNYHKKVVKAFFLLCYFALMKLYYVIFRIFKITVCDPMDPVKNCLEGPLSCIKGFEVKPSGDCWIDINKKGQSKADSVVFLQKTLSISEEETMVI